MEKCFCHFNGYEVKDAKARNDISKIETNMDNMKIANVKDYGAVGDGVTDDTQAFINALANNKNVYVPTGTYLISESITIPLSTKIYGGKGSIIKTNSTTLGIFKLQRRTQIENLTFELPAGYEANVIEISFKTLVGNSDNMNNDLNIRISKLDFMFDLYINHIDKKGNCFLISADESEDGVIYEGKGFYGVYISDIFVKGSCKSVINQYVNNGTSNWITGCYYNNFNIDSAPLYGFLGCKDPENISNEYIDGQMIYFNNWQMQCGMSKNMFLITYGHKYLTNIMPWDWGYAVSSSDKPFNILYRETTYESIYIDYLFGGVYDLISIQNKPENVNFWEYVDTYISSGKNVYVPRNQEIHKGQTLKRGLKNNQSITHGNYNKINFDNNIYNEAGTGFALLETSNGFKTGKGVSSILLNVLLNYGVPNDNELMIVVVKKNNVNEVYRKAIRNQREYMECTCVLQASPDDEFSIEVYTENSDITMVGNNFTYFTATIL